MNWGCISRRIPAKQVRPRCSGLRSTTPPRSIHLEVDGGDECRFGRPFQPRLGRSQRRRADRAGRGLRGRRSIIQNGAMPCDEIPDLAARPAAEPAPDREDGGTRFRTFGAEQLAGDAELRIRACMSMDVSPAVTTVNRCSPGTGCWKILFDYSKICLPPSTYLQENRKSRRGFPKRWNTSAGIS